jgi:hypothetical protein
VFLFLPTDLHLINSASRYHLPFMVSEPTGFSGMTRASNLRFFAVAHPSPPPPWLRPGNKREEFEHLRTRDRCDLETRPFTAVTGVRIPLGTPIISVTYVNRRGPVSRLCPADGWVRRRRVGCRTDFPSSDKNRDPRPFCLRLTRFERRTAGLVVSAFSAIARLNYTVARPGFPQRWARPHSHTLSWTPKMRQLAKVEPCP